jgi:hypothetical protein
MLDTVGPKSGSEARLDVSRQSPSALETVLQAIVEGNCWFSVAEL